MQLLVVYLTAGATQDLTGQRVTDETKAMKMPGVRPKAELADLGRRPNDREVRYDSVKAGPHGPWRHVLHCEIYGRTLLGLSLASHVHSVVANPAPHST